jgi:hypothetical protein
VPAADTTFGEDTTQEVARRPQKAAAETTVVRDDASPAEGNVRQEDTAVSIGPQDTLLDIDTVDTASLHRVPADTTAPYIYPIPSGGLHRGDVPVVFHRTEPCSILWKYETDTAWMSYRGDTLFISRTGTLQYQAIDTAGNRTEISEEYYEITAATARGVCPGDMEYIHVDTISFCMDRYEWPNTEGKKPRAFVSLYQARDSCFSVGKRLCTSEEWVLACAGPYSWRYPYGNTYNTHACNTADTSVWESGQAKQCRSFFGVYDMTGNLAEWSATRSRSHTAFFNVMGGFWESASRATCTHSKYSYYPENKHNPVGFRCCRDTGRAVPRK